MHVIPNKQTNKQTMIQIPIWYKMPTFHDWCFLSLNIRFTQKHIMEVYLVPVDSVSASLSLSCVASLILLQIRRDCVWILCRNITCVFESLLNEDLPCSNVASTRYNSIIALCKPKRQRQSLKEIFIWKLDLISKAAWESF